MAKFITIDRGFFLVALNPVSRFYTHPVSRLRTFGVIRFRHQDDQSLSQSFPTRCFFVKKAFMPLGRPMTNIEFATAPITPVLASIVTSFTHRLVSLFDISDSAFSYTNNVARVGVDWNMRSECPHTYAYSEQATQQRTRNVSSFLDDEVRCFLHQYVRVLNFVLYVSFVKSSIHPIVV